MCSDHTCQWSPDMPQCSYVTLHERWQWTPDSFWITVTENIIKKTDRTAELPLSCEIFQPILAQNSVYSNFWSYDTTVNSYYCPQKEMCLQQLLSCRLGLCSMGSTNTKSNSKGHTNLHKIRIWKIILKCFISQRSRVFPSQLRWFRAKLGETTLST